MFLQRLCLVGLLLLPWTPSFPGGQPAELWPGESVEQCVEVTFSSGNDVADVLPVGITVADTTTITAEMAYAHHVMSAPCRLISA